MPCQYFVLSFYDFNCNKQNIGPLLKLITVVFLLRGFIRVSWYYNRSDDNAVLFFDSGMNNQRLFLLQSVERMLQSVEWMADQDKKKMQANILNFNITSLDLIGLLKGKVSTEKLESVKPQKTDQDNWFYNEVGVSKNKDGSLHVSIGMDLFYTIKDEMNFNCEVPSKVEMPDTVEMPSKVETSSVMARNHAPSPDCEEASGPCHH